MTTYTYQAVSVAWEDDPSSDATITTGLSYDVPITLTVEDGAQLNYQYVSTDPTDVEAEVDFIPVDLLELLIGTEDGSSLDITTFIETVDYQLNGQTETLTYLGLDVFNGVNSQGTGSGTTYIIALDGNLPVVSTVDEWDALGATVSNGGQITSGPFAPGKDIGPDGISGLTGATEIDNVDGTAFDDDFSTGAGEDEVYSSQGNDTMNGGSEFDELHYSGDPGGVTVNFLKGSATDGWGGSDVIKNFEMIRGSMFGDKLVGDDNTNHFRGLAGNDTIRANAGNDVLRYDKDADFGGNAGVTVNLQDGTATDGFGDSDQISGIQRVIGTASGDDIRGDDAENTLTGNAGNDTLKGGKNLDTLDGGNGKDRLEGGKGKDSLLGQDQADTLKGGEGRDTLLGGNGKDTLDGGAGNDKLTGNKKSDVFIFKDGFGQDKITDFDATDNAEVIDLSNVSAITGMNDLKNNHMSQIGADVLIDDLGGNTITLKNTDIDDLGKADFIF